VECVLVACGDGPSFNRDSNSSHIPVVAHSKTDGIDPGGYVCWAMNCNSSGEHSTNVHPRCLHEHNEDGHMAQRGITVLLTATTQQLNWSHSFLAARPTTVGVRGRSVLSNRRRNSNVQQRWIACNKSASTQHFYFSGVPAHEMNGTVTKPVNRMSLLNTA